MNKSATFSPAKVHRAVEESFYPTFERLLNLHRLDFWHDFRTDKRSIAGFPDYEIYGDGWIAWVELKARQANGRRGKVSDAQHRYRESIERGGGEWRTFMLPDDFDAVNAWLKGKTGREVVFQ